MSLTPQDFVAKWKRVTSRERQVYQEHFIDLCHLVGHQTPNESDPTGTRFAFEMGAGKTSGGQGWADVAKLGYFGWEYKGKDHDLDKAYAQLLLYRNALQNPPVLIVSDINKIILRTNYTNLPTRTITLTLDEMLKPEALKALRAVFFNPEELKPAVTIAGVTEAVAAKELVEMRDRWLSPHPASPKLGWASPNLGEVADRPEGAGPKRTLTNLYNARPTWLDLAHQKLDAAILAAYGWPHDLSDEQILERLLALNLERATA